MICVVFKVPTDIIGSQYEKLIIQKLNVTLDIISDYHGHTSIPAHRISHCRQQDQAKVRIADGSEQILREQQKLLAVIHAYRDIVLLTCKTEATSILSDSVNNGKYRNKYLFTTCRKFKGLEADVVILLDVDKTTFEQGNALIFYVGTSRARIKLEIAAILSDDDCKEILMSILNYRGKIRRAQKDLAGALNAIGSLDS